MSTMIPDSDCENTTTPPPAPATFRQVVAAVAAKAKAMLPQETNGRIESAVKLVLAHDVTPQADGSIEVGSSSDALKVYHLVGKTCDCKDFTDGTAPEGWCKHRISAGITKRVQELLPQSTPVETEQVQGDSPTPLPAAGSREELDRAWGAAVPRPAPLPALPEAPASVNVHLTIAGRQVQLTLRDSDEARLLERLQAILAQYPLPTQAASAPVPVCPYHGPLKASTKGKGWYCPAKMADGSYCKEKGQ
jgi:hypothetical protein